MIVYTLVVFLAGFACAIASALFLLFKYVSTGEKVKPITVTSKSSVVSVHGEALASIMLENPGPDVVLKELAMTRCVINSNILFQYDADETDRKANRILRLDGCHISLIRNYQPTKFHRKNCIRVSHAERDLIEGPKPKKTFYIFFDLPVKMEEFFHSLHAAAQQSFPSEAMKDLWDTRVKTFDALVSEMKTGEVWTVTNDPPDWLNAILQRVFFLHHNSDDLQEFIKSKINHKFEKMMETTGNDHLETLECNGVEFAPKLPLLNKCQLDEITSDGEVRAHGDITYEGKLRLSFHAGLVFEMPVTKRPIHVQGHLAVTITQLAGRLAVRIPAPPSNRLWWGFQEAPELKLSFETAFGEKPSFVHLPTKIDWLVERIQRVLLEDLVLPHMDDLALPHPSTKNDPLYPPVLAYKDK